MPQGPTRVKSYQKGLWAERWAALYLMLRGYSILEMRYKTPVGEVDIIARKGRVLIFTEVKARDSQQTALQAVTPKSQARITRTAQYFIMENQAQYATMEMRFDVITLNSLWPFSLRHLDNAWYAPS